MSRPVDWTPLSRGTDPVPGDPDQVERSGRDYQRVADAIEVSATRLASIADSTGMTSKAVDALRDGARQVASDVRRAEQRYRGVGDALVIYAGPLQAAQEDSARALAVAAQAQEALGAADAKVAAGQQLVAQAAPGADLGEVTRLMARASGAADEAQRQLDQARALCEDAEHDRDAAARRAIAAIRDVESSGDLNDSWWDNWGKDVVASVAKLAGVIATVAGIAALAVAWIPVIGQALAAALGTIALVAALVSLVCNVALAANGDGTWSAVVFDAISVATFGLGRAVLAGSRGAMAATRAGARLTAGHLAALPPAVRVARGLPGGSSAAAIRKMLGAELAKIPRNRAQGMAREGSKVPGFALRAPFVSAMHDIRALPSNLVFALRPSNVRAAVRALPDTLTAFRSATPAGRLAIALGDAEAAQHAVLLSRLPGAIRDAPNVAGPAARAALLSGVGTAAAATSSSMDAVQASQLYKTVFGAPTPTTRRVLRLPEPAGVR